MAEGGTSWVTATDGAGKSLFQNNLEQGGAQTFTDPKQIKLVIGNAGAVHLYVNGKDLGPASTRTARSSTSRTPPATRKRVKAPRPTAGPLHNNPPLIRRARTPGRTAPGAAR